MAFSFIPNFVLPSPPTILLVEFLLDLTGLGFYISLSLIFFSCFQGFVFGRGISFVFIVVTSISRFFSLHHSILPRLFFFLLFNSDLFVYQFSMSFL